MKLFPHVLGVAPETNKQGFNKFEDSEWTLVISHPIIK